MNEKKPFYPLSDFPELLELQKHYQVIAEELQNNSLWLNWGSDAYDPTGHCKFLKGDWTICPVYFGRYNPYQMHMPDLEEEQKAKILAELPIRFPKTIALLKTVKSLNFSAFSRLHPHSSLAPHRHMPRPSLIFHLGVVIPPNNTCGLKVDEQVHLWTKPGDAAIFDDTFEHSAWNDSNAERVILYIDFAK